MLEEAFNFTDEDLIVNKAGSISENQRNQHLPLSTIFMATFPFVIMSGAAIVFTILTITGDESSIFGIMGMYIALYVWITQPLFELIRREKRLRVIRSANEVGNIQAVNKKHIQESPKGSSYFLSNETITLPLNQEQYDALQDNLEYAFYYVKHRGIQKDGKANGVIVSVEIQNI